MKTAILIAAKGFRRAKTRLAPALDDDTRAAVAERLFRHVLATALSTGLPVTVLTEDAGVAALARGQGARTLADLRLGHNEALALANACLDPQARLVVLPGDLPWLTSAALGRLVAPEAPITIAADRHGTGTNALALAAHARPGFAFRFGPDSLRLHRSETRVRGLSPRCLRDPALAFDIDTPADLALWAPAGLHATQPVRRDNETA